MLNEILKIIIILVLIYLFAICGTFFQEVLSKGVTFKDAYADRKIIFKRATVLYIVFIFASIIHIVWRAYNYK